MSSWDPQKSGLAVRLRDNPGRVGHTTGRWKFAGSLTLVEVAFGPNEKQFKNQELLEQVHSSEDPLDLLLGGKLGLPSDLRRVLAFEKVRGELTNIFYSMESSNTDFYAHQFKPVLRFVESPLGRLLIADEVGLGKTIEAAYIWKELQARYGARRLLIVCPAMLRDKWRRDLQAKFNIKAQVISASDLLVKASEIVTDGALESFVAISSLEGLRPPADFEDDRKASRRAQFARLLDQNPTSADFALFDLVIFDEAHYLRNPSTANNRLGRLLREASRHLLLLTATPIQIGSQNLYQLLRLIDPDVYFNEAVFADVLTANAAIVSAQRALWANPPKIREAEAAVRSARANSYFQGDPVLQRIEALLPEADTQTVMRIEALRLLESRSLLAQHMTRSRKREVLKDRVRRASQVLAVEFSSLEKEVYDQVSAAIRAKAKGESWAVVFSLICRQRQMASSIVGALESWKNTDFLEELVWDDLGVLPQDLFGDRGDNQQEVAAPTINLTSDVDLARLEELDTKYRQLIQFLKAELKRDPHEKFVLFAFFRGTLTYLHRRLQADGVQAIVLMGGADIDKDAVVETFSKTTGPTVLLSSEVGSEGIDLQFCRFVINYDLPWNPMRVEQRIGRLDRLGQRAERISIISLAVSNTIEDRILMRLYERIAVFRESIGDMEEILGDVTEKLIVQLFDPSLTEEEREQRAAQTELALENSRQQQGELEQEAINLVGFSDFILDQINESRAQGRWLSGAELLALVDDFFARHCAGTRIEPLDHEVTSASILLSEEAKLSLGQFIADTAPAVRTHLHQSLRPISCVFDPRRVNRSVKGAEFIEPSHPLIQWVRQAYELEPAQIHRASALHLRSGETDMPEGFYAYSIHRWSFQGIKRESVIAYAAQMLGQARPLTSIEAERLVGLAASRGQPLANVFGSGVDRHELSQAAQACEEQLGLEFEKRLVDFLVENTVRCDQQATSATKFAARRIAELQDRVERFQLEGNDRLVPMTEGLLKKEESELKFKLQVVDKKRNVDPTMVHLGLGLIRVA
jgi:SNF2 family DNA or RNA helicase